MCLRQLIWLTLCMTLPSVTGCASVLPTYAWTGHDDAMAHIVQQQQAINSVRGSCSIYMQQGAGGGVSLDGAIAARQPSYLRLRAWKFNHTAFDLTASPDGLWLLTGDEPSESPTRVTFDQVTAAWSLLSGAFFQTAKQVSTSSTEHIVAGRDADGSMVRSVIDRRTRVPLRFEYLDEQGIARAALRLERHRSVDGYIWPMQLTFLSDDARIVITMRDVEINREIPSAVFQPPSRAVRQR